MGMLDLLLGGKPLAAWRRGHPATGPGKRSDRQPTQAGSTSQGARRDSLKQVLRETLARNGIPAAWLGADMLRCSASSGDAGLHLRFLVKHWEPRLLVHGVALEQELMQRLLMLDPLARGWLMGFSWQFALDDPSICPALPHPLSWTAPPEGSCPAALATQPGAVGPLQVIEGPGVGPRPLEDVRADLEKLLALRDEDLRRHAPGTEGAPSGLAMP